SGDPRRGVRAAGGEDGGCRRGQRAEGDAAPRTRSRSRARGCPHRAERRGRRRGCVLSHATGPRSKRRGGQTMISFLEGEVVEKFGDRVTISVGGRGYDVLVPATTGAALPWIGKKARVFT